MGADPLKAAHAVDANVTELPRMKERPAVPCATEARLDNHAELVLRSAIASAYADYLMTVSPGSRPLFSPDRQMRLEKCFAVLDITPKGATA